MAKNDNMLAILWMLNSGKKITAKQISDKLEINIRTVYRCIDSLCASGVPIISDSGHNGGYRLLADFIQTPLLFDTEEKTALMHAAVFAQEAGYPFSETLDHAVEKLKKYSNHEQENTLNRHLSGFEVISRDMNPSIKAILMELEWAVADRNRLEIEYRASYDEEPTLRMIDPYGMFYWNNKWYTVAFCHLRNEIRSFRAERILKIKRTPGSFVRPESFSAKEYFLQNLLPNLSEANRLIPVVIKGRSESLDDLCLHWFLGHYLVERSGNQATFLLEEQAINHYVPMFLLSYGTGIQVIEPQNLKHRVIEITSELLDYYKSW